MTMARIASALMICVSLGFSVHFAQADLYGYIDEQGVTHLSDQKLSDHYQLIQRTPRPSAATKPETVALAAARLPASAAVAFTSAPQSPPSPAVSAAAAAASPLDLADPIERLPKINKAERQKYTALVKRVARVYKIEAALIHAVISAESAYDPYAISPRGASGLMQLMPTTAEQYGVVDIYDPHENVTAGVKHLRYLMRVFDNDLTLAIAAYNAGHNNVIKYGRAIPPFAETRMYVPRVLGYYRKYQMGI
jgi:soluble lytic murein transglycosylase-like protein